MLDIKLFLDAIKEKPVQEALERVAEFINNDVFRHFRGKHMMISVSSGGTYNVPHNLGFKPKEILQTYSDTAITWNYSSFTKTHLNVTFAGSGSVKFFVGTYKELSTK